ncbi:3-deoxy-7-phosphoheptulonate synthase [thiotrophic endosymbiont of Bathymodiolus puteoserpentis (Logatchev)]|jgi:3-deoxy-7-phosphoheptulonate synthase|uniref:3-deoxy-7-phosphoheptulonate synthase n=1 Tax=thiotrophic endosymbiont of Bathymodiolus puteoserpentis (Logatchev) TaxID=343240 RepID=UPI0010B52AA6|nr:3-deoxy-7-phosphoheptulonate synthase [thiotrophic endosymbiont of Bathymodiolus puteoserpentis (Logatchev)]CAC9586502.1 2-keto-3-deoxy-D-arabino-heptulosonate-7-phosphate synthase I alpha (EC 2.5.1.54) [uncultured Gammaproteobacteria bacterium]CAC9661103.1 2-keto-3-deoxy-D-arabino-heptulosonate-7-phosphate synthase I alpha (EC 2.5.1.54) [uncultured Gammaproteobacteria bacterium]SSC10554.1 2-keto-3-deoxy-D-arabino-heptulosonate-7-phosphate synthase I alpha [thiotrophic endosymbiont of Bathymo
MLKKILQKISNIRITKAESITPPIVYIKRHEVKKSESDFIVDARKTIANIIKGKDKRLLVVVGPCSIHDPKAAIEYGEKLVKLRDELKDDLFIVMRVYFEKPRTTIGWKGLIYDPDLNSSFNMEKGFDLARGLLLDLAKKRLPTATEYLDLITPQYISDLISWGAIGARTTESQTHRELASGLSCPVGFKNGTDGGAQVAIDAVVSASSSHMFWSINKKGMINRYTTSGNPNCHVILRGGKGETNYDSKSVDATAKQLVDSGLSNKLMVDFSHANSEKKFKNQIKVGDDIAKQISTGSEQIFGVMIESHLNEGSQSVGPLKSLEYGVSITDGCIGWNDTEKLLKTLSKSIQKRNS